MNPKPFHSALPVEAQLILRRACLIENTEFDSLAKLKAIDKANERIRILFPEYFIQEAEDADHADAE